MNKIDKQIKIETAYAIVDGFIERRKNNGDYRLRNEMEYESRDIVCYDIFKKSLSLTKRVSALMDRFGIGNSTKQNPIIITNILFILSVTLINI